MDLYQRIYERLREDSQLQSLTATYDGGTAVFYQRPAPQSDSRWESPIQYPRIDYILDMTENPERNTSGMLSINVWCDAQVGAEPEDIENRIRALLHAAFAQTDDTIYCFAWMRSDAFEVKQKDEETVRTIGVTVIFDVMECPTLSLLYPDPIKAMNEWTKTIIPDAIVLGIDSIDGWQEPTRENPVIFWRLSSQSLKSKHFTHTWLNITMEGHVCCTNAADRLHNLSMLNTAAALLGHIPMEDTSPLFPTEFLCRPNLNYLRTGQIHMAGNFGILQPESHFQNKATGEPLNNPINSYNDNPE